MLPDQDLPNVMSVDVEENLLQPEILVNFVTQDFIRLLMEVNVNLVQPINTLNLELVLVRSVALVIR